MQKHLRMFAALVSLIVLSGGQVLATDRTRLMDFDGDGATDIAVYDAAPWSFPEQQTYFRYRSSSTGQLVVVQWGLTLDSSCVADYDGDGKTDLAVYNKQTSTWTIRRSSDLQTWTVVLGDSNDTPVTFPTQNPRCFNPSPGGQCVF